VKQSSRQRDRHNCKVFTASRIAICRFRYYYFHEFSHKDRLAEYIGTQMQ